MEQMVQEKSAQHQGSRLWEQLAIDVTTGFVAAVPACPLVSSVDRAVAENASGRAALLESFTGALKSVFRSPVQYFRNPEFHWVLLLIGGTFSAANVCETLAKHAQMDNPIPKAIGTSGTNSILAIVKDAQFAKIFATKPLGNVPMTSYAAWGVRDFVGMGLIFQGPTLVASLVEEPDRKQKMFYASQVTIPFAAQTLVTVPHLLGYDFYNNPQHSWPQRFAFVWKDYGKNLGLRLLRQGPAFSLGTITNFKLRTVFTHPEYR